jgi:hypothetical protein
VHARLAAECRHAQAGVVGERRQAGELRGMARLGQGVLEEGAVRLLGLGDGEGRLRQHLDVEGREQRGELAQLAGVVGGEDELVEHLG